MTFKMGKFKTAIVYAVVFMMAMLVCFNGMKPVYAAKQSGEIYKIERTEAGLYKALDKDGKTVLPAKYGYISPYTLAGGTYYKVSYVDKSKGENQMGLVDAYGEFVVALIPGQMSDVFLEDKIVNYGGGPLSTMYSFDGKELTPKSYSNSRYVGNGFVVGIKYKEPIVIPPPDATGPGIVIDETTADIITPDGLVIPIDQNAHTVTLRDEFGDGAYDDYIMVYSEGEDLLIHRSKGIIRKGWTDTIDKMRASDQPFLRGVDENASGVNPPFVLLDMDGKQLSPQGVEYYGYRRTPTGLALKLANLEEHYYWNDGRSVSESELASFDTDTVEKQSSWIFAYNEDPNWIKPAYYPTAAKEAIDFSKDYDVQALMFGLRIGGRAKGEANQIWLDDQKSPDQSEALITFEGNNTVRVIFRAYGAAERALMDMVLNETFDRRVIYPALETIKHDIESVGLDLFSDASYYKMKYFTNELDGLKKTAGFVTIEYHDGEDGLEVVLTYPDDLYTKGIAAYNESLTKVRFPMIEVVKGSLTELIDMLFNDYFFDDADYYPVLEKYFAKQYNTGTRSSGPREVLIFKEIFEHYSHGLSGEGGIRDAGFEFTFRGLELNIDAYTEASKDFVRYTLEGIFTPSVAKYAYEQIFKDIEYVMDHELATSETGKLVKTLKGKVVTAGPFVIEYDESIIINMAYPLFDYNQLETARTYTPNIVNLGYQSDKSMTYVYNYFRPYGIVSGQFSLTKYGVQVSSDYISYYRQSNYAYARPDIQIDYAKYDYPFLRITIYNQNWPFKPNDGGVTEFMGDYFKLVFGQENADIIMKQIEKDSNAGHIYSRNPTEYRAGAFMLKYDKLDSSMSIEIKLP